MQLGMIGSDLLHALEYASILNAHPGPAFPKAKVDHSAAVGGMAPPQFRCEGAWDPELPSADQILADSAFRDAKVTSWWGPDTATVKQWAAQTGVHHVAASPEAMLGLVDGVLVCTWHGKDHAALARPFVEAGLPVFVDKPFTESTQEARELLSLAERSGSVVFTSSPWKWSPSVLSLTAQASGLGDIKTCIASGPYLDNAYFYTTHMVEVGQAILGPGAVSVQAQHTPQARVIIVTYDDGRVLVVNALQGAAATRHVVLYGSKGYLEADIGEAQKEAGMVETLARFLHGAAEGRPPLPYTYPLEATAVMEAAQASVDAGGRPVRLDTILEGPISGQEFASGAVVPPLKKEGTS
ncbi:Gfo/Idh/MocA family oxidoreductase [Pseudarthrobacter sp. NamE2]|uniref:Gfo/Idh/MocA family protein n=1 Tax=Pseudarthrobacter sp. NamE2 TaxID=2576838 RepID=UPI0010FE6458|nr:Gfo/Idh/MocA family oxidoreductase [Pseudarthrobacter sp. NamE2]TLM81984.1 Gfo/Idh/MocA family oxidoreductase [Pseudarthrobacter sp. NamE2]